MASTDSELIQEVRAITHFDSGIISDSTMQELVNIGKDELEADFPETDDRPFPGFYSGNLQIDRALFWFVCIAAKVRVGEIDGISIASGSFLDIEPSEHDDAFLFRNYQNRHQEFTLQGGPSQIQIERDNRVYGDAEWPE